MFLGPGGCLDRGHAGTRQTHDQEPKGGESNWRESGIPRTGRGVPTSGKAPEGSPDAQAQEGPQVDGGTQSDPGGPQWQREEDQGKTGQGQPEQPESLREPRRTLGKAVAPCDFTGRFLETTPLHAALGGRSHGGRLLGAAMAAARVRTERGQEGRPVGSGSGLRVWAGCGGGAGVPSPSPPSALPSPQGHCDCTVLVLWARVQRPPRPLWKGAEGHAQWVNTGNRWWHRAHCPHS